MKLCTHCGKSIKLTPSAEERAKKYGNSPSYYTNLFTVHAECQVKLWGAKCPLLIILR